MQNGMIINEDSIVGNILAYAMSQGIMGINIDDIVKIANIADEKSDKYNVSLSHRSVHDFLYDYPFLATLKDNSLVEINQNVKESSWTRYFRVGFYRDALTVLEKAFSEVIT